MKNISEKSVPWVIGEFKTQPNDKFDTRILLNQLGVLTKTGHQFLKTERAPVLKDCLEKEHRLKEIAMKNRDIGNNITGN